MSERHPDFDLDVSGLLCPLPVLKARKRLLTMKPGETLRLTATDPMAAIDVPHFCQEQGYVLDARSTTDKTFVFWIRKT